MTRPKKQTRPRHIADVAIPHCPDCGARLVVYCVRDGIQRLKCKGCGRTAWRRLSK